MLITSIVFVAAGVSLLKDATAVGYVGIAFFGLGIPAFTLRLIRPHILTLAPDGITWCRSVINIRLQWSDVQNFRPYSPGNLTHIEALGFDFTESFYAQRGRYRHTGKAINLGWAWELSAADLADLMNKARIRWAGAPPSRRT